MGMVNQMSKFSPNIAQISKPLCDLLSTKNSWAWTSPQQESFRKLKEEMSSSGVLALYDVTAETKISPDASSHGLGAVLLQQQKQHWRPVAFALRSLSKTECCYAQIEKEALALTWALEKFSEYVLGKIIHLETDHKPLIPLLGQKSLDLLPPRVLRFRLRLMRFHYTIRHVPSKNLYTADTMSRAPLRDTIDESSVASQDTEQFVQSITESLPASTKRLQLYGESQARDKLCSKLIEFCTSGWPDRNRLSRDLKEYWRYCGSLTLSYGLLLYQSRIVIPLDLRNETLQKIHHGHQGIQRCRLCVTSSVWWPGVATC